MHFILALGTTMVFLFHLCTGEVYTALAEMEELLETEAVLIGNLEAYIDAQEEKLSYLRRYVWPQYDVMCVLLCMWSVVGIEIDRFSFATLNGHIINQWCFWWMHLRWLNTFACMHCMVTYASYITHTECVQLFPYDQFHLAKSQFAGGSVNINESTRRPQPIYQIIWPIQLTRICSPKG